MRNDHINNLFWDYLEGQLSGDEKRYFIEHLEQCTLCKYSWESFKSTIELIEAEKKQEINPFFTQKILSTIAEQETESKHDYQWPGVLKPVAAVAMIVGGIMIGVLLGYRNEFPVFDSEDQKIEAFSESFYFNLSDDETEIGNLEDYEN